jgi:hypothetical protein
LSFSQAGKEAYSSVVETEGALPVTVEVLVEVKADMRQLLAVSNSVLEGVFSESFLQALKEVTARAKRKSFFIKKLISVPSKYTGAAQLQ